MVMSAKSDRLKVINEAKHLQKQLGPISKALDQLQSDSATIADACEVWCGLLKEEELAPLHENSRKMFQPSHFLSNILHPVYRGKQLKPEHIACVQDMGQDQNPEFVPGLLTFMCNKKNLPKSLTFESTINNVTPTVWWMSVENAGTVDASLCMLAR